MTTYHRKRFFISLTIVFICTVLGFIIWHIFLFASFTVPTQSMLPTIQPGDRALVDKVSTGARLFNIFKISDHPESKIYRTYRFRTFKRGDLLVFNFPYRQNTKKIEINTREYYLKRCVGIPGDTIEIRNFGYYINGKLFKHNRPDKHIISLMSSKPGKIDSLPGFRAIKHDSISHWSIKEFGPLIIPKKDAKVPLTVSNYLPYKKLIEWETGKKIKSDRGIIKLDGEEIDSYTFSYNYYFMGGDNFFNSYDSRYWGLVPEDFIAGRAFLVWWSEQFGNINWSRILKRIK